MILVDLDKFHEKNIDIDWFRSKNKKKLDRIFFR